MSDRKVEAMLREQGDQAMARGEPEVALAAYSAALSRQPEDLYGWYATAAALAEVDGESRVARSLEVVSEALGESGQLLLALAAAQRLAVIDRDRGQAQLERLAGLYAAGSPRLAVGRRSPPPPPPSRVVESGSVESADAPEVRGAALREMAFEACGAALQHWRLRAAGESAPLVGYPLLSELAAPDLRTLFEVMRVRWIAGGEPVVRQGEEGTALYLMARGSVSVSRDGVRLAELPAGTFFGEMALLTREPRTATVTSRGPVLVFEVERTGLEEVAARSPSLAATLAAYTRQRLLRVLLATSPLFERLDVARRTELVDLFSSGVYDEGMAIVTEGGRSDGLYVVLSGEVRVSKREDGEELVLARLASGQVFGEISLIKNSPATATVTASCRSVVLCLAREVFNDQVAAYPEVLAHAYALALEREQSNLALEQKCPVVVDEIDGTVLL